MLKASLALLVIVGCLNATAQNTLQKNQQVCWVKAVDVKQMIDTTQTPMIVNFWATWCGPCVRELQYFDSIIDVKQARVKLLLVSLDFPEAYPARLSNFVRSKGYKGEVVYLAEEKADYFIPVIEPKWNGAIPASIFIDRSNGYYQLFNFQLTRERFALEIDALMKASKR